MRRPEAWPGCIRRTGSSEQAVARVVACRAPRVCESAKLLQALGDASSDNCGLDRCRMDNLGAAMRSEGVYGLNGARPASRFTFLARPLAAHERPCRVGDLHEGAERGAYGQHCHTLAATRDGAGESVWEFCRPVAAFSPLA